MYMALTRPRKIEKQASKVKQKTIDPSSGAKRSSAVAPEPGGQIEATPAPARIIGRADVTS